MIFRHSLSYLVVLGTCFLFNSFLFAENLMELSSISSDFNNDKKLLNNDEKYHYLKGIPLPNVDLSKEIEPNNFFHSSKSSKTILSTSSKFNLQASPTILPTISFMPTKVFPTLAPVPTKAPVPTPRPSVNPTPAPSSNFIFSGPSTGQKYLAFTMLLNAQETKTTFYNTFYLPSGTTDIIGLALKEYFGFSDLFLSYQSLIKTDQSTLSWTLDLTYTVYAYLNGTDFSAYASNPIGLYISFSNNNTISECCLPTIITTYYDALAKERGYNTTVARPFFFQTMTFSSPRLLTDPANQPTAAPTSTLKPTVSLAPSPQPTTPISHTSSSSSNSGLVSYVFIIIGVVGGGVLIAAFIYYLYATKQYCFKILEKEEDDEDDEDDDNIAAADATFVKPEDEKRMVMGPDGVMIEMSASHPYRRGSYSQEHKDQQPEKLDDFTVAMNSVGSWFGVPPAEKPVLNTVDLNSAFDNWLGTPQQTPNRRRSNTPPPPPGSIAGRRNSNTNLPVANPTSNEWSLDNISSWLVIPGITPEQPTPQQHSTTTPSPGQNRRPRPPGSRPRGPPPGYNGSSGRFGGPPSSSPYSPRGSSPRSPTSPNQVRYPSSRGPVRAQPVDPNDWTAQVGAWLISDAKI